jgi:DNA-3-methyladenine glycosylase I
MEAYRCDWCLANPTYIAYHDTEWDVPIYDDVTLFEALLLETFQAGLSWWSVLKKRDNFRKAFYDYDVRRIAQMTAYNVNELMQNKGIIRNRGKITMYAHMQAVGMVNDHVVDCFRNKEVSNLSN